MKIFQNLFSTTRSQSAEAPAEGRMSGKGPETVPVKMNLDERMEFRRELLFETVRSTLDENGILPGCYRLKVMRTDRRGHCYAIMMDMSSAFMDSAPGQYRQLAGIAARLTDNARTRYGLVVTGMYWRVDETLDVAVASWARPPDTSSPAAEVAKPTPSNIERYEHATADQLAAFEAAWQQNSDIQIGNRTYSSDLAPLGDDAARS